MVMKIENPLHIHCKKYHHVGHKLELVICRHCENEIFREKIALNSFTLNLHSNTHHELIHKVHDHKTSTQKSKNIKHEQEIKEPTYIIVVI